MKKLIDHYKEWIEECKLPKFGLCHSVPKEYKKSLYLFVPTDDELDELASFGISGFYWASGLRMFDPNKRDALTPLRETIILLICAMHDEI
jgi:hypothetical protein